MEAGVYRVDVVVVPSTISQNRPERSNSQTKTASFFARVDKVTANIPAIETANCIKTVTGTFNGTTSSLGLLTTALSFSSASGVLKKVLMKFGCLCGCEETANCKCRSSRQEFQLIEKGMNHERSCSRVKRARALARRLGMSNRQMRKETDTLKNIANTST